MSNASGGLPGNVVRTYDDDEETNDNSETAAMLYELFGLKPYEDGEEDEEQVAEEEVSSWADGRRSTYSIGESREKIRDSRGKLRTAKLKRVSEVLQSQSSPNTELDLFYWSVKLITNGSKKTSGYEFASDSRQLFVTGLLHDWQHEHLKNANSREFERILERMGKSMAEEYEKTLSKNKPRSRAYPSSIDAIVIYAHRKNDGNRPGSTSTDVGTSRSPSTAYLYLRIPDSKNKTSAPKWRKIASLRFDNVNKAKTTRWHLEISRDTRKDLVESLDRLAQSASAPFEEHRKKVFITNVISPNGTESEDDDDDDGDSESSGESSSEESSSSDEESL
jgi:hypothetical protein